mgnify:CR=1 FL=1
MGKIFGNIEHAARCLECKEDKKKLVAKNKLMNMKKIKVD